MRSRVRFWGEERPNSFAIVSDSLKVNVVHNDDFESSDESERITDRF